jgi:p-aminobenzoyl-glutamate transporter AbgT
LEPTQQTEWKDPNYRPTKFFDPFVVFLCVCFLIPIICYGIVCGIIRDIKNPPKSTKTCTNSGQQ